MCFITVLFHPCNTSNEQQIHKCKISVFSTFCFFSFLFFFHLSKMAFMSTAQRFSLLNISLINNTFCFWDQLVGGWPLFFPSWHFYKACWARTRAKAKPRTKAQTLAHRQAKWSSNRPWVLPRPLSPLPPLGSGNWADRGTHRGRKCKG